MLGSASSLNGAMPLKPAPSFSMGAVRHPQKGRGSWVLGDENSLLHGVLLCAASLGALSSTEQKSTSSLAENKHWEVARNSLMPPFLARSVLNCWEQNAGSGTASSENLGEDLWLLQEEPEFLLFGISGLMAHQPERQGALLSFTDWYRGG